MQSERHENGQSLLKFPLLKMHFENYPLLLSTNRDALSFSNLSESIPLPTIGERKSGWYS